MCYKRQKEGRLAYFLTGVQLLRIEKNNTPAPHKFGVYTQQTIDDEDAVEPEPEF